MGWLDKYQTGSEVRPKLTTQQSNNSGYPVPVAYINGEAVPYHALPQANVVTEASPTHNQGPGFSPGLAFNTWKYRGDNAFQEYMSGVRKSQAAGDAIMEFTGVPSLMRVADNPVGTLKGISQTTSDLVSLPYGLTLGAYNSFNGKGFNMGNNIWGQPYGEGLPETLDALTVLPLAGQASRTIAPMTNVAARYGLRAIDEGSSKLNALLLQNQGKFFRPRHGVLNDVPAPDELRRLSELDEAYSMMAYQRKPDIDAVHNFVSKSQLEDADLQRIFGRNRDEIMAEYTHKKNMASGQADAPAPRSATTGMHDYTPLQFDESLYQPNTINQQRTFQPLADPPEEINIDPRHLGIDDVRDIPAYQRRDISNINLSRPENYRRNRGRAQGSDADIEPRYQQIPIEDNISSSYNGGRRRVLNLDETDPQINYTNINPRGWETLNHDFSNLRMNNPRPNLNINNTKPSAPSLDIQNKKQLLKGLFEQRQVSHDRSAVPGLFANNYNSKREMLVELKKNLDRELSLSQKGQIVTGSTNTSHNSYLPQMDFVFKNAGKQGLSDPQFLGYHPMNSSGFLSQHGLENEEILRYLNANLNKIQQRSGANLNLKTNAPYINDRGEIMIPQYGLKKITDDFKGIKKKEGGDVKVTPNGLYEEKGPVLVPTSNGRITMKPNPKTGEQLPPTFAVDNTGFQQMMYPGMEYMFPGNLVYEIPLAQSGLEYKREYDLYADNIESKKDTFSKLPITVPKAPDFKPVSTDDFVKLAEKDKIDREVNERKYNSPEISKSQYKSIVAARDAEEKLKTQADKDYTKASVSDIKALQQQLSNLGYDIGKSGIDGKYGQNTDQAYKQYKLDQNLDLKTIDRYYNKFKDDDGKKYEPVVMSIQSKLVENGLLKPNQVDGKFGNVTKQAIKEYNTNKRKGSINFGEIPSYLTETRCAAGMCEIFESKGIDVNTLGIKHTNAWDMVEKMNEQGNSKTVYNIYDNPKFKNVRSADQLKALTREVKKTSQTRPEDYQIGDIVGIFYSGSSHHAETLKSKTHNTHVGWVVDIDKNGKPIIAHNMYGKVLKDPYDELVTAWIQRPNKEVFTLSNVWKGEREVSYNDSDYKPTKDNSEIIAAFERKKERPLTSNERSILNNNINRIQYSAGRIAKDIKSSASPQWLEAAAFGILGVESSVGLQAYRNLDEVYQESSFGQARAVGHMIKGIDAEDASLGSAKIKYSKLSPLARTYLGINSPEDLSDDNKSVDATIYKLATAYDIFADYAKQYPELGLTEEDIQNMAILSHNQGVNSLLRTGRSKKDEKQGAYDYELELADLRSLYQGTINDPTSTNWGRVLGNNIFTRALAGESETYISKVNRYINEAYAANSQKKYGGWLDKYQEGGEENKMPLGLPLRSHNPSSPWAYESPTANGYLLPDINKLELLNTGATEYKIDIEETTIPTVVDGNYLSPEDAYTRYMLFGEKFKPMASPSAYSEFYNMIGPLGLMQQKSGGDISVPDRSKRGRLDKYNQ